MIVDPELQRRIFTGQPAPDDWMPRYGGIDGGVAHVDPDAPIVVSLPAPCEGCGWMSYMAASRVDGVALCVGCRAARTFGG